MPTTCLFVVTDLVANELHFLQTLSSHSQLGQRRRRNLFIDGKKATPFHYSLGFQPDINIWLLTQMALLAYPSLLGPFRPIFLDGDGVLYIGNFKLKLLLFWSCQHQKLPLSSHIIPNYHSCLLVNCPRIMMKLLA